MGARAMMVLAAMLSAAPCAAQPARTFADRREVQPSPPPAASTPRPSRAWSVSIATGRPGLAPLASMERAMRTAAFDRSSTTTCFFDLCFGPTTHPYSIHSRIFRDTWTTGVHRHLGRRLGLGVTTGVSLIGWTTGSHRFSNTYLEIETTVRHLAPVVTVAPWTGARVGIGPALFTTSFTETIPGPSVRTTVRRPGVLTEAAVTFPRRARVFLELAGQMRWVMAPAFGPVSRRDELNDVTATFPRTDVNVSHWFLGLGAGLRF
jgi:hypothetical protein